MSSDGAYGITLIAFVGSVFSPYYAWARRRGQPDPLNYCAFNIAHYGNRHGRWAMTERAARQVRRESASLAIGPSRMRWTGDALVIDIDEVCVPLPRRICGTVRLVPASLFERTFRLATAGRHFWTPFAPRATVEVSLSNPQIEWSGVGYFDSNSGDEPLEHAFSRWTWSRAASPTATTVLYDVHTRDGNSASLALRFGAANHVEHVEAPPIRGLPNTGWRLSRHTRTDAGTPARIITSLEDAPFYSRAVLDTCVHGVRSPAIHESLDLDRFNSRWVQCLLPFRMPRVTV